MGNTRYAKVKQLVRSELPLTAAPHHPLSVGCHHGRNRSRSKIEHDRWRTEDIIEFELVVRAAQRKRLSEIEAPNTAAIVVTCSKVLQLDASLQLTWMRLARLFAPQSNINSKIY
jgi:hypothetical protein